MVNLKSLHDISLNGKSALSIAVALFLFPLLYFDAFKDPSEVPRYTLIALMAIVTTAFRLSDFKTNTTEIIWHPLNSAISVFALLALISGFWALDSGGYYLTIIPFIGLILIYFNATYLYRYTRWFLYATLVGASYAAVIGLLQSHQIDPFGYQDATVMASTFTYKNHAALYFDLVVPASIALIFVTSHIWLRWAVTIASAICLGYILETHTRGSWLALTLSSVLIISFLMIKRSSFISLGQKLKERKLELLALVLITFSITYTPSHMDESWSREASYGEKHLDTSSQNRLLIYKNSLQMLIDNPLGVGLGSFWKEFREYTNTPNIIPKSNPNVIVYRAHSEPLQFFLELGIFGGLLALLIFFQLIKTAYKTIPTIQDEQTKILYLGIVASVLTSALHSIVDFPLHKPASAALFWLYSGLIIGFASSQDQITKAASDKSHKVVIGCMALILLIYSFASIKLYANYLPAQIHYNKALKSLDTNCDVAIDEIEKAIDFSPHYFRIHNARVDVYFKCVRENSAILPILDEELTYDDTNAKALIRRGYVYMETGRYESAFKDFSRVVQLLPHRPHGHFGIAQTILASGNIHAGIQATKKVIERFPNFQSAKDQLRDIEDLMSSNKLRQQGAKKADR